MKKKVIYITVRSDMGGGPKHIYQLLKNYDHNKYDIYLACPKDEPFYTYFISLLGKNRLVEIPHRTFTFKKLLELKKFISKENITVIHSHGKGAGIYSRLLKIVDKNFRIIHTYHGIHYKNYSFIIKKMYFFLEYFLSHFTNIFICVSSSEKEEACLNKIINNNNKIKTIYNGVNVPKQFYSKQVDKKIEIVIVSRFDFQKNTSLLIQIIEELLKKQEIDIVFHILGEGEDQYLIKKIKEKHEHNVYIYGNVSDPSVYYNKCHFILNTSRWEGLSLSILEAMAHGCIPILSNVTGNTDIIKNTKIGLLFDNIDQIINYLNEITKNSNEYSLQSSLSHKLIHENFNEEKMIKNTFEVY